MIKKLTPSDFGAWKQLRLEGVKAHPESFGESYQHIKEQDVQWFEQSLKNGTTFAYEQERQMVGLVGMFSMQPGNMKHRAVLFGLYVKPEYRKQGLADALVHHAIEYAKPDHTQIHVTVTTNNEPAFSLYKKHGFILYGTEPNALRVAGQYFDEYLCYFEMYLKDF